MLLNNTFRAFRHRDYLIYWCGLFVGHSGTLIQTTAQSWLIFQLTNSPYYLGLEGLCLGLPRVLLSPLGGAIVDRSNRKVIFALTHRLLARDRPDRNNVPCQCDDTNTVFYFGRSYTISEPTPGGLQ
jgi:hypothetical protein